MGFYVGAGVGQSQIRSDDSNYGYPGYYNDYQFAWKAFVGIRPISHVGAEAEYIDFGQPTAMAINSYYSSYSTSPERDSHHPTATALFAVGYLPIPVPFFDIFAKAGGARLSTNVHRLSVQQPCVAGGPCPNYSVGPQQSVTDTKFAYGAGVQSKFPLALHFARRIRAHQLAIRRPRCPDGQRLSWTF